jgi:hypothetical protein
MKENRLSICHLQTTTLKICAFNFLWASFLHSGHKPQVWPLSTCPLQSMTLRICVLTFLQPSLLHSEHKPQVWPVYFRSQKTDSQYVLYKGRP